MSNKLYEYISKSVQQQARINQKKYSDLAKALNVSESFIHKIHANSKHYNVSHLYVLSRLLNCDVSDFYPKDFDTYKRLYPLSSLKRSEFKDYLQEIEYEILYGKDEVNE